MLNLHLNLALFRRLRAAVVASAIAAAFIAAPAFAATPSTSMIDGVLTSSGGSAAADGDYDVTFSLYEASSGGTAAWAETAKVKVTGGRFSYALGSVTPINVAAATALKAHWLGLKVGTDPELARQSLHASLFASVATQALSLSCDGCVGSNQLSNGGVAAAKVGFNYAGSSTKGGPASDVECTSCVNVSDMKFDGDVDLVGNSIKAKNATFSGTVAAAEFVGDGSKLTGIKTPSGECSKTGEVVKGINADGSLKCVAALDPTALPKDGLNEISNDLLSNQFVDTMTGAGNVAIPDNTGAEAVSNLDFADIGISQTFEVTVDVSNSDLSKVSMVILPPDDKKTGWTLCDPCGDADAKEYKKTFTVSEKPKSGDIAKWIGANPKGLWSLKVLDTGYCISQKPGNNVICDVPNNIDGKIVSWSIKIQTLSNKKIAINGDSYQSGTTYAKDVDIAGTLKINGVQFNTFANKPATFRWNRFRTYDNSAWGWLMANNAAMYGGIAPSNWTNGSWYAWQMSTDKEVLRTLFINKAYAGKNAMVVSEVWPNYSSDDGMIATALFRIKNTTNGDIVWKPYYYFTGYGGWSEYASVTLNGASTWSSGGTGSNNLSLTIPKNRTSTVIFVSAASTTTGHVGAGLYVRSCTLGFYNDSLALPTGLEFIDDLDTATGGWEK
jgi:hypothetical protein